MFTEEPSQQEVTNLMAKVQLDSESEEEEEEEEETEPTENGTESMESKMDSFI